MAESAQELLQQGIDAAQAQQKEQARTLLQQAVRLDPQNEHIWLWLSSVAKDNQERIFCLRQLLAINPQNEMALKGLRALGVSVQAEPEAAPGAAAAPGVPIVSDQALAAAQPVLDRLLEEYGTQVEPEFGFEWVRKTRGRFGERSATYLTAGAVFSIVAVVGVVLVVLAAIIIPPLTRGKAPPTAIVVSFRPTETATPTLGPTNTPSPRPRISPTPSPTYGPDVPDGAQALEDSAGVLTPTPVYFFKDEGFEMNRVAEAYIARNYAEVPELAQAARDASRAEVLLNSYFYEGMAYAMMGQYESAEGVLLTGMDRGDSNLLDAALGYVYYHQGRFEESTALNERAIEQDSRLELPSLTQADVYLATGQYDAANDLMERVFDEQPVFNTNVVMLAKRGETHLARGNYDAAIADARKAIYIDPFGENAYLLVAEASIAKGLAADERDAAMRAYGTAVLDMQSYLFRFKGSILGYALLGRARYLEGNLDLALAAYNQALVFEGQDVELTRDAQLAMLQAHLGRAAMYLERRLYPQAYADYDSAVALARTLQIESRAAREGRTITAFYTGKFRQMQQDLEILLEDTPGDVRWQLLSGQTLVHLEEYEDAEAVLTPLLSGELTPEQQATVNEYLARVHYHQAAAQDEEARDVDMVSQALDEINAALAGGQSGSRHYYRGLIYELAGEPEKAKADYEWVLVWEDVYGYPFRVEVRDRLDDINEALAEEEET